MQNDFFPSSPDRERRSLSPGADGSDFLPKPAKLEQLQNLVTEILPFAQLLAEDFSPAVDSEGDLWWVAHELGIWVQQMDPETVAAWERTLPAWETAADVDPDSTYGAVDPDTVSSEDLLGQAEFHTACGLSAVEAELLLQVLGTADDQA